MYHRFESAHESVGFEPDNSYLCNEVEPEDSYLISLRSQFDGLSERDRSRFSISPDNMAFDDAFFVGGGNDY